MCLSREKERKVHVVNETNDSDSQSDPEFVFMVTEGGSEIEETGQPVNADETVRPVNAVDMYSGGTADACSGLKRHLESSHTQK